MNLALAPLTYSHIVRHSLCIADHVAVPFDQSGELRKATNSARLFSLGLIDELALRAAVLPAERRYAARVAHDDSKNSENLALAAVLNACGTPLHPASYWLVRYQCAAVAGT